MSFQETAEKVTTGNLERSVEKWRAEKEERAKAIIRETRCNNLSWTLSNSGTLETTGIVHMPGYTEHLLARLIDYRRKEMEREDIGYVMYIERISCSNLHTWVQDNPLVNEFGEYMFAD